MHNFIIVVAIVGTLGVIVFAVFQFILQPLKDRFDNAGLDEFNRKFWERTRREREEYDKQHGSTPPAQ